jgi:hypothetical protein
LIKIETQIRIQSADKTGISNKYSSVVWKPKKIYTNL